MIKIDKKLWQWKLTKGHNIVSYSTTGLPTCRVGQIITTNLDITIDHATATTLENTVEYLYYRIVVESVPGRPGGREHVVLRDIKMFGQATGNQF